MQKNLTKDKKKQICIARALIKKSSILLLDDPLFGLDETTAHEVQKGLNETMKNKTCVLIGSNLAFVKHVDHIIFLEHGRVLEEGSYKKLISNPKGKFLQLLREQEEEHLTETSKADCVQQTLELISDAVAKSPDNTLFKTLQNNVIAMADYIAKEKKKTPELETKPISTPEGKPKTAASSKFFKAAMQVHSNIQSNKPSFRSKPIS